MTLVATGGIRDAADFAKALALGADAVAVANSAIQAIGCLGMRACHTDNCPVGIATQKPHLRARLPVDEAAERLDRFLRRDGGAHAVLARACGHHHLHEFTPGRPHHLRPGHGPPHRHRLRRGDGTVTPLGGPTDADDLEWHRVADLDELADGRVATVLAGHLGVALTRCGGRYGALDNHCPHQGGPLGEGSIEKGWLRCPWHGYDYDPLTGTPPPGFSDAPESLPGRGARRRGLCRPSRRASLTRAPCPT